MKHTIWMLPLLLLSALFSSAQENYYDFYYTNLPTSKIESYGKAFRSAFDRIYLPGYSDSCRSCAPIAQKATTNAASFSGLREELLRYLPADLYFKQQVPGSYYHIVGNRNLPYIIRTLYKLNDNKAEAVYQVKVTFSDDQEPAIQSIEVFPPQSGKRFSRAMVFATYRLMVEEPQKLARNEK